MFYKVCGMTRERDIDLAIDAGATHIGLIFAPGSDRCIEISRGKELLRHVGDRAHAVGVFRKQSTDEVIEIADTIGLDWVQLHGGFESSTARALKDSGRKVLWAVAVNPDGKWVDRLGDDAEFVDYLLLDTKKAGSFGGTGLSFEWPATERPDIPFFLAGGLGNHNAVEAYSALRPAGLDFNSALEESPGEKRADELRALAKTIQRIEPLTDQPTVTP
jgi:phosphoribosylanthranilate isomerase